MRVFIIKKYTKCKNYNVKNSKNIHFWLKTMQVK